MKKLFLVVMALAAVLGMSSCKSASQEDINNSFDKVYSAYVDAIITEGAETYTVQRGDTLTSISKKFYGDANGYYFPLIMLASHDVVLDPELIEVGMNLTVPQLDVNIRDKTIANKLKKFFKDVADVYKQKRTKASADIRKHLIAISNSIGNN